MRTQSEEAEFQALSSKLGIFAATPEEKPVETGLLGFTGQTLANLPSSAAEKIVQPLQTVMSGGLPFTPSTIPRPFDTAPQGLAQHGVAIAGELLSYLPAIALTEGAAGAGLAELGMSARAAKIGGSALGFGLPMAPEGPETVATQAGVGGLFEAARPLGWRGRLTAGVAAGGLGFYEGAKGEEGSVQQGATYGALNLLGPTLIDPAISHIFGAKEAAAKIAKEGEAQPHAHQPAGPIAGPVGPKDPADITSLQVPPLQPNGGGLIDLGGLTELPRSEQPVPFGMTSPTRFRRMDYPPEATEFGGLSLLPESPRPSVEQPQANLLDFSGGLQQIEPPNPPTFPGDNMLSVVPRQTEPRFGGLVDLGLPTQIRHPAQLHGFQSETGFGPRPDLRIFTQQEQDAKIAFDQAKTVDVQAEVVKQKPQRVIAPEGAEIPQPTQEGPHVIASAVKQGKKILVGSKHNAPHEQIGLEHGLTTGELSSTVPEEQRGFLVQNADGTQGFANRKRAAKIAQKSGQLKEPTEFLKSESPWSGGEVRQTQSGSLETPQIKTGDNLIHWSPEGMPIDVLVSKVDNGVIHYTENDLFTGQTQDKVASLQEFNLLEKHPSERPQPIPKTEPVEPAASDWKLAKPKSKLTAKEKDWFDWAESEAIAVMDDPGWREDNPDWNTVEGQLQDISYRLKEQAYDVAKTDATSEMLRGRHGVLNKLIDKLEKENYFDVKTHQPEPVTSLQQVRVKGKYGLETATILSREGDSLNIEIDDPIFGKRQTTVLAKDTLPLKSAGPETPKHGVPFQDIEGAKTQLDRADERYGGEGGMLGSVLPETEFSRRIKKTLPGREKTVLSVAEGLKLLPPEAATILGQIIKLVEEASGQKIDLSFARKMIGQKGGMFEGSGRVVLNLQWINGVLHNWDKMNPEQKGAALMRIVALFGHEISHVAHKFGERTLLQIDGQPLTKIIVDKVAGFNKEQRHYIAEQIKTAKGDLSGSVSAYLAGDIDAVYGFYKRFRPNLTREQTVELAAGEMMAEIGAVELISRTKVEGLPDKFRQALDKFKQVLVRVVDWFRSNNMPEQVAALQSLREISAKMFDHFGASTREELEKAFPAGTIYREFGPQPHPLVSGNKPLLGPSETVAPFMKKELARLGLRAAAGGVIGGTIGPKEFSTSEGILIGGVLGAFGPSIVKTLINQKSREKLIEAAKAVKGGPFASLQVLTQGRSLRELGADARYGWKGDGSFLAKVVRSLESEFDLHLDPKIRAIIEQARGVMGEVFSVVEDALKKARWSNVSEGVKFATTEYIEGRIDKDIYRSLLSDEAAKNYGEFMITAREGTSIGTDLLAAGMRKSAFREHIIDNREKYVGKFYKAYRDGEFDMSYFQKVKEDFLHLNPELDSSNADALLREHMIEIKANRRLFTEKRGTGAQAIESKLRFRRRATEEEIYMKQLEVAGLEHNPYGAEYKAAKSQLDWMENHKITDNWRGWLGEIKDPAERMVYTFQKIYPSSIAGKIFDLLDNSIDSFGNKFAYQASELNNTRRLLESEIAKAGPDVVSLQTRIKELENFVPLPEGAGYGKLSGKFVSRFVRDQVATYDTPYKWLDQPIMRGISSVNNIVKIDRTVLNPLTVIRNYLQIPLFMLIGRSTPRDVWEAAKVIHKGFNPELLTVMRQRHILGVDYAASELTTNLGHMISGYFDSDAAVRIARAGYDKAREIYQQPDMLQRAGAFISALRRYSERMELPQNHPSVIDAAVDWTDKLTMNYSGVPRVVKAARQLPFVSLFVSYTSEITRILKNLTQMAISNKEHIDDRMHAIMVLSGMAAIPVLLTTAFEGNLSPKDKTDWDKLRKLQPSYARSRFMLPLSRDKEGRFHYMDVTTLLPADNYTQMMKSALQGDGAAVAAANPFASLQDTPLLNIATEQISGKDLRTGRDVQGFGRIREVLKEVLPPIVPPGFEGERLARAFSQNQEGGWGLTNIRTGVQTRPSDIIANYLTGIRFSNVSLSTIQRQAISETQQQIAHEQQFLRDTINTNVSGEQKVIARNRYTRSVQEIMNQLHSRLQ